jgi:hypothetical protein
LESLIINIAGAFIINVEDLRAYAKYNFENTVDDTKCTDIVGHLRCRLHRMRYLRHCSLDLFSVCTASSMGIWQNVYLLYSRQSPSLTPDIAQRLSCPNNTSCNS